VPVAVGSDHPRLTLETALTLVAPITNAAMAHPCTALNPLVAFDDYIYLSVGNTGRLARFTISAGEEERLGGPAVGFGGAIAAHDQDGHVVLASGGVRFAHLGDTYLDGVQPLENVDVLFIPIGGFFTMDVEEALEALDIIKPDAAIPMHFNTFSQIKADPQRFKQLAENAGHRVTVLSVGEKVAF
jgi:L-ascorbate metabolism protein UlaG (beta-lactamase superfamily)